MVVDNDLHSNILLFEEWRKLQTMEMSAYRNAAGQTFLSKVLNESTFGSLYCWSLWIFPQERNPQNLGTRRLVAENF